ncbi:MAG: hypothetical protein CMM60_11555 [Rhodospirillaceae bacterium]|jgi:hypothetical protein|nr:hypothetical protein [Rhodospirillaceae bacterium]|tara:strand:+ start:3584 stop:7393 length:3810 start_codon:yes stop_codon:yes gene_type:complete
MRRQRATTFRKAALGLIACGSLLVFTHSASAQSDNVATDPVVQGLTNCDLGKRTKNLHVLFVLDESGSLTTHDPDDRRVDGTKKALEALQGLANRFSGNFNIDVAIHGFSGGELGKGNELPYRDENPWLTLPDEFDALIDDAKGFTNRNIFLYTDYRAAIEGAIQAFDKHDPDQRACKALVWFTDGVYDSENNTTLTPNEIEEITGELCIADGSVDHLRERAITVIAIGLSNKATGNPPDLSLVKAIASGDAVTPDNPDLTLPGSRCGILPGTGDLYEENDPGQLVATFEKTVADGLFEASGELSSTTPVPCTEGANVCTVEFELGPWVKQFALYLKLPPRDDGQSLRSFLDPPGVDTARVEIDYPDGPLPGITGVTGESPTRNWRILTGNAEAANGIWNGVWKLQFEGPGAAEAKANLEFFQGTLEIQLDPPDEILDRANPDTFTEVDLKLKVGNESLKCNETAYPLKLDFVSDMGDASATFQSEEKCLVPEKFLLELLTAKGAESASSIGFAVKPSLKPVNNDAVPPLEFTTSEVSLDLANALVVELARGSQLDRSDPESFKNIQIELQSSGRKVDCGNNTHLPVNLDFTSDMGHASATFKSGEKCLVPSGFLDQLVNTGLDKDALSVTFNVEPSLVVDPEFPDLKFSPSAISIVDASALVVELAEGSRLDRSDPESFENVGLGLFRGRETFLPPAGSQVSLYFSADLDGRLIDLSATYGDNGPFVIRPGFLKEALFDEAGRDLVRFTFEVTPEITGGAGAEGEGHPTYEPSTIHIWLHDPLEVRRADDKELDREDRSTHSDVEVELRVDGQKLSDDQAQVSLEFATEINGSTVSISQSYPPGGPYVIPSGFFEDVFQAAAGSDLLDLKVSATPTLTIDGRTHPGYVPSPLQFSVRTGKGFPTILTPTATDFDDTENSTLTVLIRGPNDGNGKVEIRSISGLPTDLPGTITLVEPKACEVPSRETLLCEVELEASFTANREIELDVDLVISGDRTKVPGQTIQDSVAVKPFKMTRPLSKASFISKLLQLLALFVAVQTLMRVLYTTRLARWKGAEAGSRWTMFSVSISSDGGVTAADGTDLQIEALKTYFATELESPDSSAQLGDLHFSISWWQTFIGERKGESLVWQQRPIIRVWSPDSHCIGPEGTEWGKKQQYALGRIGLGYTRCWVLQVSGEALDDLAKEQTTTGRLVVILFPAEHENFDEQLEEIRDRISDVTGRELPSLLERFANTPVEAITEPNPTDTNDPELDDDDDDGWGQDHIDPLD